MTEAEIRSDEREKIIRMIERADDYYTSFATGYTEKQDIKEHLKRYIIGLIRSGHHE